MDYSIISNALMLVLTVSIPVLGAALAGAIIAGVLRVATQIDDPVIGFAGRLAGIAVLGFFAASRLYGEVATFAAGIWGNSHLYH